MTKHDDRGERGRPSVDDQAQRPMHMRRRATLGVLLVLIVSTVTSVLGTRPAAAAAGRLYDVAAVGCPTINNNGFTWVYWSELASKSGNPYDWQLYTTGGSGIGRPPCSSSLVAPMSGPPGSSGLGQATAVFGHNDDKANTHSNGGLVSIDFFVDNWNGAARDPGASITIYGFPANGAADKTVCTVAEAQLTGWVSLQDGGSDKSPVRCTGDHPSGKYVSNSYIAVTSRSSLGQKGSWAYRLSADAVRFGWWA